MTSDYKTRRDEAADKYAFESPKYSGYPECFKNFKEGADWARADLMAQVEEILVKALEIASFRLKINGHEGYADADEALTAWQAIKETDNG
jgi:hypothetical protein